jgi:hypothetical protein
MFCTFALFFRTIRPEKLRKKGVAVTLGICRLSTTPLIFFLLILKLLSINKLSYRSHPVLPW